MKVFKFGGASVKDAESVKNIPLILDKYQGEALIVIVSAMNKTTNALEALSSAAYNEDPSAHQLLEDIKTYHLDICRSLFPDIDHPVFDEVNKLFANMTAWIKAGVKESYDHYYDQLVSYGELLSTLIISNFLNFSGKSNTWLDARELIITDDNYRSARVKWDDTSKRIQEKVLPLIHDGKLILTQGFIGHDGAYSTTLGREGSDFSAAIFASILEAEEMVVWKDVPGYLNADPVYFDDTVKLDSLSYTESIELAFFGAKIIHPKTIRPLQNKQIPLLVKSFMDPDAPGSVIHSDGSSDDRVPSYIIKEEQMLVSIASRDFSFIAEEHLHMIFGLFAKHHIVINLMQNSAISFSVCIDHSSQLPDLLIDLQEHFHVKYNDGLQLLTVRHYDKATIEKLTSDKEILLEQRSRTTVQMVIK